MESSKHNDELIKRKLADLSVEPRKLKFAEVHANYEKARKASSKKWGLYFIFGTVGIAALIGAYVILTPKTNDQLAENTVAAEYSSNQNLAANQANNIQSVGTTSEDKSLERSDNKANINDPNTSTNSTNETVAKNTDASTSRLLSGSATNKETNASANAVTEKTTNKNTNTSTSSINKKETTTSTGSASKKETASTSAVTKKKKTTNDQTGSSKNTVIANPTANSLSGNKKIGESITKTDTKKQDQKASYLKNVKETHNKATGTQPLANSNVDSKAKDQNSDNQAKDLKAENNTKDIAKNETPENNNNSDQSNGTQKGSNDQNNNGHTTNANSEGKNESSTDQITKADSVSNNTTVANKVDSANAQNHIPGVVGSGSVSPRNKHKFLVGAEVSYSTLFYSSKENPNSPAQFSTGDPAFSTAYTNAVGKGKHSLFNGTATFGYLYNEKIGITAGLSYFNLETKVDLQPSRTPQYTTAVDYYVWNWVQDTSVSPPTLTLQIVDTAYKQVPTGNYSSVSAMVNGDSANTVDYTNKIRYISIPLNLSYAFKIGAKFSIEPQAGIIYTMPLKSSHLVATDAYKFDYNKQKTDLRKNLYFNAALKLGYNIGNRTQLYIRQGYFFRDQSIYKSDQPISLSLKSIYTSFGINFRIK